jgi:hypothetical protein
MLAVDHSADYYTVAQYAATFWAHPGAGNGSGQDAGKLSGMTKAQLLASSVPVNTIIIWHGNIATPPAGFLPCDGVAGAPDMKDKLPFGGNYNVGTTGGVAATAWTGYATIDATTLNIQQLPHHLHDWNDHYPSASAWCNDSGTDEAQEYIWNSWTNYVGGGGSHSHTATVAGSNNNYPLCKAVNFLIKT